jgi:hypothetical protein
MLAWCACPTASTYARSAAGIGGISANVPISFHPSQIALIIAKHSDVTEREILTNSSVRSCGPPKIWQLERLGHISSVILCELRMRTKKIEPATGPGRLPPKRPPAASVSRRRKSRVVALHISRPSSARLH